MRNWNGWPEGKPRGGDVGGGGGIWPDVRRAAPAGRRSRRTSGCWVSYGRQLLLHRGLHRSPRPAAGLRSPPRNDTDNACAYSPNSRKGNRLMMKILTPGGMALTAAAFCVGCGSGKPTPALPKLNPPAPSYQPVSGNPPAAG